MLKSVCVFCGSSDKIVKTLIETAHHMGQVIAQNNLTLVFGGGKTGLMGAVSTGALEAGGNVIGVITDQFNTKPLAADNLGRMEVLPDMHTRKARMAELSDAFIALPGGFGTLEELFEILTWSQIGLHTKPVGLLNTEGYYDHLLAFIQKAKNDGFIYAEHQELFVQSGEPKALLTMLLNHSYPEGMERWVLRND